jgi:hypothetical protein
VDTAVVRLSGGSITEDPKLVLAAQRLRGRDLNLALDDADGRRASGPTGWVRDPLEGTACSSSGATGVFVRHDRCVRLLAACPGLRHHR